MQYGIYTPNFGPFADPRTLVQLAPAAEEAGWDGFFLSDNLAAAQGRRSAIPGYPGRRRREHDAHPARPAGPALPRRHLGGLAREAVTLDHLSRGRLILGVGSGDDLWREYSAFGPLRGPELGAMLTKG